MDTLLKYAFTTVLGPAHQSNPQKYAALTMSLQGLIGVAADLDRDRQYQQAI